MKVVRTLFYALFLLMFSSCNSLPQGFLEETQAVEIEILTGDGTPILVFESSRPNDLDRVKGVVSHKKAPLYKCAHTGMISYISKDKVETGEFNLSQGCRHIVFMYEGELLSQELTKEGYEFLLSFMEKGIKENNEPVVFHYYGELLPVDLVLTDSLTLEYGFQLKRVAGDGINEVIVNDAKKFNDSSFMKMKERYGDDWRKDFEEKTGKELKYYLDN